MQLKNKQTKKICATYGKGAMTNRTCQKWFAKFHAGDFLLDNVPLSNRPVEVDSDQIKTLRTINFIPCKRESAFSKYPNQALKIIFTTLVMLITLMFGFPISQMKHKKILTAFPHVALYLNEMRIFHF